MIELKQPTQEELIQQLESDVARLEEENKELIKVAEFYGDYGNYSEELNSRITITDADTEVVINPYINFDEFDEWIMGGRLARETLKKIQELREEG